MPLPLASPGGEALFVTDIQPLTVVGADLVSGSCHVVHGPSSAAGHGGGGSDSDGKNSARDIQTASAGSSQDGGAAKGSAASLAAVLGGARLHGGSPFVPVDPSRYLRWVLPVIMAAWGSCGLGAVS